MAERLFGGWASPTEPLAELPACRAGDALAARVIVIDMPEADQSAVSVALRGIARTDSDFYPLALANSGLDGSSTSRLNQEVRVKRALSYGARSQLQVPRDEGLLIATAQTRNETAPEVAIVMLGEIRRLASERHHLWPETGIGQSRPVLDGAAVGTAGGHRHGLARL